MKAEQILHWEFSPADNAHDCQHGWGQALLYLFGQPFWHGGSPESPTALEWTWSELLHYLAVNWGALLLEQSLPFSWLETAETPEQWWQLADNRWADMNDEAADGEERTLLDFDRRHNLAAACQGMALPALSLLRSGHECWLWAEGRAPVRMPLATIRRDLLEIGNNLAHAFQSSARPEVQLALQAWQERAQGLKGRDFLRWTSGQSSGDFLAALESQLEQFGSRSAIVANDAQWAADELAEGPLLAAARMANGVLAADVQLEVTRNVLQALHRARGSATPEQSATLARLTTEARRFLQRHQESDRILRVEPPFETGYALADWLRNKLGRERPVRFDIKQLVEEELGVRITEQSLGTPKIDALALWHGTAPCIILNSDRKHSQPQRTRMTLAHELAHLLLDRDGALPFCEVLGGTVDHFIERRANAFAAELLLPRSLVENRYAMFSGNFREFAYAGSQEFDVSKSVLYAQVKNSTVFDRLDAEAREFLEKRLQNQKEIAFK